MMSAKQPTGFTIFELLIVVVLLGILMIAVFGVFFASQETCLVGSANLMCQTNNTRSIEDMTRQIRQSRIFSMGDDPDTSDGMTTDSLTLQRPIDANRDGQLDRDADDHLEYGFEYGNPADWENFAVRYALLPDPGKDRIDERELRMDVDGNGGTTDTFLQGFIEEQVLDMSSGGTIVSRRRMTPSYIVMTGTPLFTRVNARGEADAFGTNVRISFISFWQAKEGRVVVLRPASVVAARNLFS